MQELVLYIKPQQSNKTDQNYVKVDLFNDENVGLTQVLQDIRDIEKIFTDYSRTFNIPASKKNNKLFKHWYNPDIDGFDSNTQSDAKIELNYQPFREGKIQLQEVKLKNNKPHSYKITFYGNTVSFKNLLGNDQLKNLVWLNNLNYTVTTADIINGLSVGLDFTVDSITYNNAIIYPLLSHSQRYIYDGAGFNNLIINGTATATIATTLKDTNNNFTNVVLVNDIVKNTTNTTYALVTEIIDNNTLKLSGGGVASGETYEIYRSDEGNIAYNFFPDLNFDRHGVLPQDLKPAIKVSLIIKAITEQYGITFKSGGFFDTTVFDNFYLWLHRDKGAIETTYLKYVDDETFTCVSGALSPTDACVFFGGVTPPKFTSGTYEVIGAEYDNNGINGGFSVTVTPTTSALYTIEIINVVNNDVVSVIENVSGTTTLLAKFCTVGSLINWCTNGSYQIAIGETAKFVAKIKSSSAIQFGIELGTVYQKVENSLINIWSASYTSVNTNILTVSRLEITEQIPEINVIDFLKGLFKMYNLTAYILDNEIIIKSLNDFYDTDVIHDLSRYVNTDQHTVSESLPFTDIDLEYVEAKSKLAQVFKNLNNRKYGEVEYTADASRGSAYKIEAPFEHMLFERLQNLEDESYTNIQYGLFTDDKDEPSIGKPLLFHAIYQTGGNINFVDSVRNKDGTLPASAPRTNISNFWLPHNASELGTTTVAPEYNLNFGSEINSYTLTDYGGNNNSLFQLYYEDYIVRVFNNRTRIFKYNAVLPLNFLLTYTLADRVLITGRTFTIKKITTDLQTGKSTLELLNQAPTTEEEVKLTEGDLIKTTESGDTKTLE